MRKRNLKKYIKNFGFKIFLIKAIRSKFYNNYSKFGVKLSLLNEKIIKNFLQKNIINNLIYYKENDIYVNSKVKKNSVIWTMWWQGLDKAPAIIKTCIKSVYENNPNRKIILITEKNYQKYIKLNPHILDLLKNKKITFTHFSDICRVNLLYLYGGVWIDATVWTTGKINNDIFRQPFYSIRTNNYTNDPSHGRWTGFFMEARCGSKLFNFLRKSFNIYWNKYDILIDYILVDYFISLATDNDVEIKNQINNVPINNVRVFKLQSLLKKKVNRNILFDSSNTYLYKLSYKNNN